MKFSTFLIGLILIGTVSNGFCQSKTDTYVTATNYDARLFLTKTQIVSFDRLYPEFDSSKAVKNWEWKDVDPLGLFSPEENRTRRRELFLFEYTSTTIDNTSPTEEQLAFKLLVSQRIEGAQILIDKSNIKILSPYTDSYERDLPLRSLLEKLSDLGLQWGQTGGINLYIYNGNVLMGKYKSGYVSLSDLNIDKPFKDFKKTKRTTTTN
jgi:hypothetical protein